MLDAWGLGFERGRLAGFERGRLAVNRAQRAEAECERLRERCEMLTTMRDFRGWQRDRARTWARRWKAAAKRWRWRSRMVANLHSETRERLRETTEGCVSKDARAEKWKRLALLMRDGFDDGTGQEHDAVDAIDRAAAEEGWG